MKNGFDLLAEKLGGIEKALTDSLIKRVTAKSEAIAGYARKNCPVETGDLRNSIEGFVIHNEEEIIGGAVTNHDYAAYVEFGTGPTGTKEGGHPLDSELNIVRKTEPWLGKVPINDKTLPYFDNLTEKEISQGYAYRRISGQKANPFMYRALKENEEDIINEFGSVLKEVIKDG